MLNINDVLVNSFESAKLLNSGFYGFHSIKVPD